MSLDEASVLNDRRSVWLACLAGMLCGFVILAGITVATHGWPGSLFKLMRVLVEGLATRHVVLLFITGVVWGLVLEKPYSRYAAGSQLLWLPLLAICEMIKDPTSHNLWPLEFMIYAALAFVCLAGVKTVDLARRWL